MWEGNLTWFYESLPPPRVKYIDYIYMCIGHSCNICSTRTFIQLFCDFQKECIGEISYGCSHEINMHIYVCINVRDDLREGVILRKVKHRKYLGEVFKGIVLIKSSKLKSETCVSWHYVKRVIIIFSFNHTSI